MILPCLVGHWRPSPRFSGHVALYAEGRDLRRLVAITGEAALSAEDRRVLDFAQRFETSFLGQGPANREVSETLDLAWQLLAPMPADLLKRIPREFLDQYHGGRA